MPAEIRVKGAREHNLRDVSIVLPRNRLICFTGVSGSGKSSLSFDTLYAEGQRRYVESLSSYARHFMGQLPKPDVDLITGLSPSISISQKSTGHNPRSTVGTITEIYDFLRVLYARIGTGHCPDCNCEITAQTREQIVGRIQHMATDVPLAILAPLATNQKGEFRDLFEDLRKHGYSRGRVDGRMFRLEEPPSLDRLRKHNVEVVIDRLPPGVRERGRLADAVDQALKASGGTVLVLEARPFQPVISLASNESSIGESEAVTSDGSDDESWNDPRETLLSSENACPKCGQSFPASSPQLFSFNSPQGMCTGCDGLGHRYTFVPELLIQDENLSIKQGVVCLLGPWADMTSAVRTKLQNVADSLEPKLKLDSGKMLTTPWAKLPQSAKDIWLWGAGKREVTYVWKHGRKKVKYVGTYDGIVADLVTKYKEAKNPMVLKQFEKYMDTLDCPECNGKRLNPQACAVTLASDLPEFVNPLSLPEICELSIAATRDFISNLRLSETSRFIAVEAIKEITARLGFLLGVGLNYLSLSRTAPTLSGGESQRIRLAGQIGSGLVGVLYILDEPSIGLHPRDNQRLIETLLHLRDVGNTLIVVEHDEDTMRAADLVVDFGPGPGVRGGKVVAMGTSDELAANPKSITGKFLSGAEKIEIPAQRRPVGERWLKLKGARHNNLKQLDIQIPLGALVCITGVSGSGKSSLVGDILEPALRRDLNRGEEEPGDFDGFEGLEHLDKMVGIDQSPIGRTPRSNPATYVKVFDEIRTLFARLPEAKRRGFTPGRFSFNVDGGRCSACDGNGANKLEMDFLADVWVTCPLCEGRRYSRETLEVRFKGHSISDVLNMDIDEARKLFVDIPKINEALTTLHDVGLDYLKLGQPSPTLSGGEAQRIKLSRELTKRATGRTIYLLDEPTTGLHFVDIRMLLKVLHDLVDKGNTVVVVEHNLDVIKTADWVIDLGPEGGRGGGELVFAGRPEDLLKHPTSHTGYALSQLLDPNHAMKRVTPLTEIQEITEIRVEGAQQHNLKSVDVSIPRDKMTVFCGPSGSGKTSLAMDTIYAEGQRRYVESLSSYARQFLGQMQKPKVDRIEGLSPAVALEQRNQSHSPRSTVGTVTEVYDYYRVLLARLGVMHCPKCQIPVGTQTIDQIVDKIMALPEGTRALVLAPHPFTIGDDPANLWTKLRHDGYVRVRVNGTTHSVDAAPDLDVKGRHRIQVVVDRLIVRPTERSRIADSVEKAVTIGAGVMELAIASDQISEPDWREITHSLHLACTACGRSFQSLTPHHFSFNSAIGWCSHCEGLGTQTGTNPKALLRDETMTLAEGAMLLWPNLELSVSRWMLAAFHRQTGIPLDVPFEQLSSAQRRLLFHGMGSRWFEVQQRDTVDDARPISADSIGEAVVDQEFSKQEAAATNDVPLPPEQIIFRFQFKGFYPALEEAARLSPTLRNRLEQFVDQINCTACDGSRLHDVAAAVRLFNWTPSDLMQMPLERLLETVANWKLNRTEKKIAGEVLREIQSRVEFLTEVGLEYLTLGRGAATLSGGESQRIRLAGQLGSGLCGVLYILDEPTIGLHPRDGGRLLKALHKLRDLGNTLLVVEHDREIIAGSDHLCDFGPLAGRFGGHVVAQGSPAEILLQSGSVTGPYLSGAKAIPVPAERRVKIVKGVARPPFDAWLTIRGARENNLRDVDVALPLGTLTAVTGPSGSGKSSLIDDILYPALARKLHRANVKPGRHDRIEGMQQIDKVIRVDQSPLGNSPTSNPATYSGAFELVRVLFAKLPESQSRGFTSRQFSFNVPGGRCDACEGSGQRRIEMHFLPDVWVTCESCLGKRYKPETLEVTMHGKSINDVLDSSIGECIQLFEEHPKITKILQTLADVGLDYVTLGQAAPTLSGGEAQRVKLAAELARPDTGRTLYLLDEPTTGLHFEDVAKLLRVLHRLVDMGNTVVVIEHNLDVVKQADWIIDMGPEAGAGGGRLVVAGTPEMVAEHASKTLANVEKTKKSAKRSAKLGGKTKAKNKDEGDGVILHSYTGEYLGPVLAAGPIESRTVFDAQAAAQQQSEQQADILQAAIEAGSVSPNQKKLAASPWEALGVRWHTLYKGFPVGEKPRWPVELAGQVVEVLDRLGATPNFSEAKQVSFFIDETRWAILYSKRTDCLRLVLYGAIASFGFAEAKAIGIAAESSEDNSGEPCVVIDLLKMSEAQSERLQKLLTEHVAAVNREYAV